MKRLNRIQSSLILSFLGATWLSAQSPWQKALDSITPEELKGHVVVLADDAMQGRETPSPQLDSAAAYIAGEFQKAGLKAPDGSYYQVFNTLRTRLGAPNTLTLHQNGADTPYEIKDDFVPLSVTANGRVDKAPVVFVGYGITAPEYGYDDYAGVDAQGKVVMLFDNEPQAKDSASVFAGIRETDYAQLRVKVENALEHGAVGLLLMSDPHRRFRRPPNPWPSLMRNAPTDAIPLKMEQVSGPSLVAMQIGKDLSGALTQGLEQDLLQRFEAIDADLKPRSCDLPGVTLTLETQLDADVYPVHNVWALLEGSDPKLKDEVVVIGGHYDHVGVRNGEVFNGADDNASGTSGVIEVAEAFAQLDAHPKRSLLFMAYAGEEKGLYGSHYYVEHPLYPMDQTVAMFCMDMISRNETNTFLLIGDECSNTLTATCEEANKAIGMDITKTSQWFFQSDHYPFYKKGVPVLFFNSGETEDLHKPTDDVDKINPEKMSRIARLLFLTAYETANAPERPDYIHFK